MNYRILAISTVATAGLIAFGLYESQQEPKRSVERMTTVDVAEAPAGYDASEFAVAVPPPVAVAPPPTRALREAQNSSADFSPLDDPGAIAVAMPKIAYRFAYGFRLPEAAIRPLQERHADMCEAMGTMRCRIISLQQTEGDGEYASGSLRLAVASDEARRFGKNLAAAGNAARAELVSSSIDGEDLSKKIVDTEARLRARTVLRDRLLDVLRNRDGTVRELVEAERGVAQVNEEIDQAQSWLSEMRARVAFSEMALTYEAGAPATGGFAEPVRNAWGSLAGIVGGLVAVLMTLLAVLVPLGLLAALLVWLWRRLGPGKSSAGGWLPPVAADT